MNSVASSAPTQGPGNASAHSLNAVLVANLTGDSPGRTAVLAEVTVRTVRRWRRQPLFQAALADARLDFFSACRSHLNASLAAAFQILADTAGYSGNRGEQLKAATFPLNRVAHTEMSAKPLPKKVSAE